VYQRAALPGDLTAGVIVAIMLVPQGMAYAVLAGLPPQTGLYASIVPLFIYGLLGSSRVLAVGPVAIVSLMVGAGVAPLSGGDGTIHIQLALTLALLVGFIQIFMGLLRVGFVVNYLSYAVLVGFMAAAAIIIGFSQVKHLLGFAVPKTTYLYEEVLYTLMHLHEINVVSLAIGVGSIVLLCFFKQHLPGTLERLGLSVAQASVIAQSAPLVVVIFGTMLTWHLQLNLVAGLAIVGETPAGLPPLTLPTLAWDTWRLLFPTALAISAVGYMQSISAAKSLASRRHEKIDANQELLALGAANLGATVTGGFPVTSGFSRSVVNFAAGANSGLASIFTAGLMTLTVVWLTPLFFYLPKAILAAIILVAVTSLVDIAALKKIWHYSSGDTLALLITFVTVLAVGIEMGIVAGVVTSLLVLLWRTSRPHLAVVGRVEQSEQYRDVL